MRLASSSSNPLMCACSFPYLRIAAAKSKKTGNLDGVSLVPLLENKVAKVKEFAGLNNYLVCENDTPPFITFEGSNGTAPYTFTYQINSDPVQQVVSSGTSNTATISVSTINSGTNVITLLSVSDSSTPTACTSTNITLPNEAFVDVQEQGTIIPQDSSTVSQVVCQDTAIAPIVFDIGGSKI